jgi:hypothetical protein
MQPNRPLRNIEPRLLFDHQSELEVSRVGKVAKAPPGHASKTDIIPGTLLLISRDFDDSFNHLQFVRPVRKEYHIVAVRTGLGQSSVIDGRMFAFVADQIFVSGTKSAMVFEASGGGR